MFSLHDCTLSLIKKKNNETVNIDKHRYTKIEGKITFT